jgi:DNA polymerase I-like protein with 3'-5' exonuclease and polymerase domains
MTYIIDIEADNFLLEATTVWCAVIYDTETKRTMQFTDIEEFVQKLNETDCQIVGHNILMYDLPLLRRLYGFKYKVSRVYDTILVSRLLEPDRLGGHSLDSWGKRLGVAKGNHSDFSKYTPEMLEYCTQDVKITELLYNMQQSELRNYPGIERSIQLEHEFAYLINKQIEAGFTLDVAKATELSNRLSEELSLLKQSLKAKMAPVPILTHYKSSKEKGIILSEDEHGYTYTCRNLVKVKKFEYEEPNPTSRQQIANYLVSKGWKPTIFTETGLPKIDETALAGINIPEAKEIGRMFRVQKMLGMLSEGDNAWLKLVKPSGRVHGDMITCGTNTGRASHARPNISQVDKDKDMRGCWKAKDGWKLVGTDASGLELRILAHYLAPYDKGAFAYEVMRRSKLPKDQDIHCYTQQLVNLDSRDAAKTFIYALIYGAGNIKLGYIKTNLRDDELNREVGGRVRGNVADNFVGYVDLLEDVKKAFKVRGYLRGIDNRPLHPRQEYSALNLLIQSAGALVMKQATINSFKLLLDKGYKNGVHYNYVASIHDELQIECDPTIAEVVGQTVVEAIRKAGTDFNLRCELDGEYKVGDTWASTH